jgi:hypothetical protein
LGKHQAPTSKLQRKSKAGLALGASLELGAWNLYIFFKSIGKLKSFPT